jgi:deoxycytidylate deaminase
MKHDYFVEQAMLEAGKSNQNHRHGSVIVHRSKIIARGYNKVNPLNCQHSLHAEVAAINEMKKIRNGPANVTMYVIRLGSCGTKNSKPCVNCERSIIESGIRRVYFSCNDP